MTLDVQTTRAPVTGWKRDLVLLIDRLIYHLAKHWLAVFNLLMGTYVLLPVLAPLLMAAGVPQLGRLIHLVYRPACHQLADRSFFLFGSQATYTVEDLRTLDLIPNPDDILARERFVGAPGVGFKMAICQRDIALYGGMVVAGLLFGLVRKRVQPMSLLQYGLWLLPMVIDGGTQLVGLRESNWVLRLLTGAMTGYASVRLLYPHLEAAFADLRMQANERVEMD
jgi:uncharacterized membrane protein